MKSKLANDQAERLLALQESIRLKEGLPFLHGWKWYSWARDFYESQNKINLLCAANQISKSSTQIRKCINWATDKSLWPALWVTAPKQFWYLYPTRDQVSAEFETKWKQFLPTDEFKDSPEYGWRVEKENNSIKAIHFNSGVHVYFKTYSQDTSALQTGTCDAIFCDEELDLAHYEELMFRLSASNGYFHMVFTATLGQDFWRRTMEPEENEKEELVGAWKRTVSMYDCMFYEDGTKSHWSMEKIKRIEARCSTHNEVLKRVFGKFIMIGGRKYESFDIKRHKKPWHTLPANWLIYAGADPGSGGEEGHPAALCYVGVSPDYKQGRVFLSWRGDGELTTAGDVVEKHIALLKEHKLQLSGQYYDWANKDFDTISTRMGYPFIKADKSHEKGEHIINTLFKNDMMFIYETEDNLKLCAELSTLLKKTAKKMAKDDLCDAFRYAVTLVPWDFSAITNESNQIEVPEKAKTALEEEEYQRRRGSRQEEEKSNEFVEDEISEWNRAYGW
jgi:hypothetical protein